MKIKRVFLIVLDSVGMGELPDADKFGDVGSNTLRSISKSEKFKVDTLRTLGLFNIDSIDYEQGVESPMAAYGRMAEKSAGKDTTIGHWEIGGIYSEFPMPTYPDGFPQELIDEFAKRTGRGVLCNKPYSGTQVIDDFGREHMETGALIVYTSADSVFQIAAHESVVPIEQLYEYCKIARELLTGEHSVGRVIARPFTGEYPHFERTSNRHDFSLLPPKDTILNELQKNGFDTIAVGKINDIFAGSGVSKSTPTRSNADGMEKTAEIANEDFNGICFINLVDFDMKYGHRNDIDGYANALSEFDAWLGQFLPKLKENDILMITADHGCDPGTESTDHSREYVPLIVYGKKIKPVNLGTRSTFSDIAATIADLFGIESSANATSFAGELLGG